MGENWFVSSDKDLEDLKISPELRSHMNLVLYRVKRIFPIIYRDMERILNTPHEQLVEMTDKALVLWPEWTVRYGLMQISTALVFLRTYQQEIHIASIPIQGITIYNRGQEAAFIMVTTPETHGPLRSAIYDVFYSKCIMLFHPISFYMPDRYLGPAIVSMIAECIKHHVKFSPPYFVELMSIFSEIAKPPTYFGIAGPQIISKILADEKAARHMIDNLKRIGARLVLESFLYDKILNTKQLSRLLLDKSIIENIPPVK